MQLGPQQEGALKAVSAWLKDGRGAPVFRLFGYAGTGKTTLARRFAEGIAGETVFCAYTGKAALVMQTKGCRDASTLHSLLYRATINEEGDLRFSLNRDSRIRKATLIVVDECSMVNEVLGHDLLSFGVKVLVLGDPFQLPPVEGGGFFTYKTPDFLLQEVHRQAADDPIVALATRIRKGHELTLGEYGSSAVVSKSDLTVDAVRRAGQMLVGTHKARRQMNIRVRRIQSRTCPAPEVGDLLVCLRNQRARGLFNGSQWTVSSMHGRFREELSMTVVPAEDPNGHAVRINVPEACFVGGPEAAAEAKAHGSDAFDYGYAMTVHKAQGSQWDSVLLFDEGRCFEPDRHRWLYTGITRAAVTVTVAV